MRRLLIYMTLIAVVSSACSIENDIIDEVEKTETIYSKGRSLSPPFDPVLLHHGVLTIKYNEGVSKNLREMLRSAYYSEFIIQKVNFSTCNNVESWIIKYQDRQIVKQNIKADTKDDDTDRPPSVSAALSRLLEYTERIELDWSGFCSQF